MSSVSLNHITGAEIHFPAVSLDCISMVCYREAFELFRHPCYPEGSLRVDRVNSTVS